MGRPPILKPPASKIDLRIGQDERDALASLTEATRESHSGLIRRLLLEEVERQAGQRLTSQA